MASRKLIEILADGGVREFEVDDESLGLRAAPVADFRALIRLVPKDFEIRRLASDGCDYVFSVGAVSGDYQDAAQTGYWIKQSTELVSLRRLPVLTLSDLANVEAVEGFVVYVGAAKANYVFTAGPPPQPNDLNPVLSVVSAGYWVEQDLGITPQLENLTSFKDAIDDGEVDFEENTPIDAVMLVEQYNATLGRVEKYSVSLASMIEMLSLRGKPVLNTTVLANLDRPKDGARRKVTSTGQEFEFKLGSASGDYADAGATGYWIEQKDAGDYTTRDGAVYQKTDTHTYTAWQLADGTGYIAQRRDSSTGDAAGEATGALPVPTDLSTLTYL